eukprot:3747357-Rhodomonas_salina.1
MQGNLDLFGCEGSHWLERRVKQQGLITGCWDAGRKGVCPFQKMVVVKEKLCAQVRWRGLTEEQLFGAGN